MKQLRHFSMQQIDLMGQLSQVKGLRELARKNNVDPASVSRLLQEAERVFGFSLAVRTNRGLSLTNEGQQVSKLAAEMIQHLAKFDELKPVDQAFAQIPTLTLGSRGFLVTLLAGIIAEREIEKIRFKLRFVDSSPPDLLRASLAGIVDIAVHLETWNWPSTWLSTPVAHLTWGLVVRQQHPLGSVIKAQQVQKFPFVGSSYLGSERVERSLDAFPLKWSERKVGHESQTAFTSRAILLASDHVAFLPLITLEKEIKSRQIRVVQVKGMKPVQLPIHLSVNQDRVPQGAAYEMGQALAKLRILDSELSQPLFPGAT